MSTYIRVSTGGLKHASIHTHMCDEETRGRERKREKKAYTHIQGTHIYEKIVVACKMRDETLMFFLSFVRDRDG